jgi:hypothetical protein
MARPEKNDSPLPRFSGSGLVLAGFLATAVYFLWTEHQAHTIAALPWILIGGCLVMHLFMHRAHGNHDHRSDGENKNTDDNDNDRRAP